jgi:O-succinylbenzoic acid--CoA ligase
VLGLRESDLAAVFVRPGPRWSAILAEAWDTGAAILPLDHRLPRWEADRLIEAGTPTLLVQDSDSTRLRTGAPVDRGIGLVMATSGTRGRPRLAELSQEALRAAVSASASRLGATADDRWICCLPLAHMGGMLVALRGLLLGSPVEFHPGFDPAAIDVAAGAAAFTSVVPAMLARLLDDRVDLRRFRAILVGGDGLSEPLASRAAQTGARIVPTYGLTESCGGVVYDGEPLDGVDVRIGAAGGPDDGEVQEVLLKGATLFQGYRGDPPATEAAFAGPWLRTRDAGALRGGRLQVFGRLDDVIVTGGEKVWPGEVEDVLRQDPSVRDVAVLGRPDPVWGSLVVAYVIPADPKDPPTRDRLQLFARERLARHKIPRDLVVVEALPTTRSGKVRRAAL